MPGPTGDSRGRGYGGLGCNSLGMKMINFWNCFFAFFSILGLDMNVKFCKGHTAYVWTSNHDNSGTRGAMKKP